MIELNAFIEAEGARTPFQLHISDPMLDMASKDFYCSVHIPQLLANDKNIYGASAQQANDLAIEFVSSLLGSAQLVDNDGARITLQQKQA